MAHDEFKRLFEPGKIGALELKNRIIMPAMGTRYCGIWGEVTDMLINWYRRRAEGGCAMVTIEATMSATAIDPLRLLPRQLRADDTSYIAGLAALAEAIHDGGAKAGLQLSAGGGAQAKAGPWTPGFEGVTKLVPVSPSGVTALGHADKPRILEVSEIKKIIELCGEAALNVKRAGFDLVEIGAHGGYLITQFMSPYFNKRTDDYGGSFDNRCRFLMEIIEAMRRKVGPDFALTVKFSIEDCLPGGWDIEQSKALVKKLEAAGIDAIGISSGVHEAKMPAVPPYFYPKGTFIHYAEAIRSASKMPIYLGGRLNDPAMAEQVLKEGKAEFICQGRAVIADPDWPKKVAAGQVKEIRPCLACNECRHAVHELRSVKCSVNAVAGREREIGRIRPADVKKKVLVVGGGPGGMEAARVAAMRGHQVTLCEQHRQLGGLMLLGGVHNEQISEFAEWHANQVKSLPIDLRLNTEVTPALVQELKPDAVILAVGGTFQKPDVPGIDRDNVFSAHDLLNLMNGLPVNKGALFSSLLPLAKRAINAATVRKFLGSNFPIKKNVAIIGGQFPGCSLAIALGQRGKKVLMIEEAAKYGRDMEAHTLVGLRTEIEAGNVRVLTSSKVAEITDRGVVVADSQGNKTLHEVDTVIVALELAPTSSKLAEQLNGKVKELYTIGDAISFRRIIKAVGEGYITSYTL
ncbi:MAG: FAD-dependent oxidoreductase [Dehalococcoidales bacterium]|nr:FAD-dependent oxidoreductase [Dehalococcoidales bacterium]